MSDMEINLKYLHVETSRHGKTVVYVRRNGKRVRLTAQPGTPDFLDEYRKALSAIGTPPPAKTQAAKQPRGTLGWLIETYYRECVEFRRMRDIGQRRRRTRMGTLSAAMGDKPALMTPQNIMAGLAKRAATPGAANDWLKDIKSLYTWAHKAGYVASNPGAGIGRVAYKSTPHHTWTLDEIAQYLSHHHDNDRARLACLFLLISGLRRDDATRAGRQHIRNGRLSFQASKNAETRDTILPDFLLDMIGQARPGGTLAILTNNRGGHFASGAAFGNWMRDRCDEAGLQHCAAHGLRSALATIASENSGSEHEIMALLADRDPKQAQGYTRAANQKIISDSGMLKVIGPIQTMIRNVAPKERVAEGATKSRRK